ncbi:ccr4-not transcription complex subunit [Anaeramoeba flamelloides]|uniref:Ccr4-not transcription complex subunit n=1 Tax=Anaeramoeba flamelloides TaxID=1746091 RepID=A0AAV7ZVZ7_9EUKA|nr:ccr4-not transcription complex subunit [Anaeramoeba flamelloides]
MYPNEPYNSQTPIGYKGYSYGQRSYNSMTQPKETRDLSFRQSYTPYNEEYYNYTYQNPQNSSYPNYYSNTTEKQNENLGNEMYGNMGTGQQMFNENQLMRNNNPKGNEYRSYFFDEYSNSQGLEMGYGQQQRSSFQGFSGNNPKTQTNTLNIKNPQVDRSGGYIVQPQQSQKQQQQKKQRNNLMNYGNSNQIQDQYLEIRNRNRNRNRNNGKIQNNVLDNLNLGLKKENETKNQTTKTNLLFHQNIKQSQNQNQNQNQRKGKFYSLSKEINAQRERERERENKNKTGNEHEYMKEKQQDNLKERRSTDKTNFKDLNSIVLNGNDKLLFLDKTKKLNNNSKRRNRSKEKETTFENRNHKVAFKNLNNSENHTSNNNNSRTKNKSITSSYSSSSAKGSSGNNSSSNQLYNQNYNYYNNNNYNYNNYINNNDGDESKFGNTPFQINEEEFPSLSQVGQKKKKSKKNKNQRQVQVPNLNSFKKSPRKKNRGKKLEIMEPFEDEIIENKKLVNDLNAFNNTNHQNNRYQDKKNENNSHNNRKGKNSNAKSRNKQNKKNKTTKNNEKKNSNINNNNNNNQSNKNKNKRNKKKRQQQQRSSKKTKKEQSNSTKKKNNDYPTSKSPTRNKELEKINESTATTENSQNSEKQQSNFQDLWEIVESNERKEQFLLSGLIKSIKMTGPTFNTLTFGIDLRTLGLDLNTSEKLCSNFESPWGVPENRENVEHEIPDYYYTSPQVELTLEKMSNFSDLLLLYIFYSSPRDALQVAAVEKLLERGWSFHKEHAVWIIKDPESKKEHIKNENSEAGSFIFFNPETWDMVREENFILRKEEVL